MADLSATTPPNSAGAACDDASVRVLWGASHLLAPACLSCVALRCSSLPGSEHAVAAPVEAIWKLAAEEELRLEIEGRGIENKCVIQVKSENTRTAHGSDRERQGRAASERLHSICSRADVESCLRGQLLSGTAELFGTELMVDREYTFSPASSASSSGSASAASSSSSSGPASPVDDASSTMRFAIFSWHGAELRIRGPTKTAYKKSDTPMISYINAHAALENLRELTRNKQRAMGPRTMVIGAPDTGTKAACQRAGIKRELTRCRRRLIARVCVDTTYCAGKSTLCRLLLSYAVRAGSKPLFIDLDVGQNAISVPGTISSTSIEHPISVEMSADMGGGGGSTSTLSIKSPLTFFYGHATPSAAPELYAKLLTRLASVVERRMVEHPLSNSSGFLVNTCGWVDSAPGTPAYELLIAIAQTFSIDVILVLDRDDLTQALKSDKRLQTEANGGVLPAARSVSVAQLSKSGGVATRDAEYRKKARARSFREYFYGPSGLDYTPHQKVLSWKELEIYRVGGGPAIPNSMLPIGAKRISDPNKLTRLTPSVDLLHSILALSYAKDSATMLDSNVAGFVHVSGVDVVKKTITLLTPAPGPLPNNLFIAGQIKWID